MSKDPRVVDDDGLEVAKGWCASKGLGWTVGNQLGQGGTASVFEVESPDGLRALKIYDAKFSVGEKGQVEVRRIEQQVALGGHDCPWLVQVYAGGAFDGRLFVLMSRSPGTELEKRLDDVPRERIRGIVSQVAQAAAFLRSKDLCHRDIKSANIFVSDTFEHATLLDISVIRKIQDPIGMGTDYDGQLPVLATARYSPPEYLFRLIEPSQELWNALNVYQLGALLHDLIMREPLFEVEYHKSAENRYRFAWVVATTIPEVHAGDVDQDLVFTAKRALDKDWQRRSSLTLEDFMDEAVIQQRHALQVVGLDPESDGTEGNSNAGRLRRVRDVAQKVEEAVTIKLREQGGTAEHSVAPGTSDISKILTFDWDAFTGGEDKSQGGARLELDLSLDDGQQCFTILAALSMNLGGNDCHTVLALPSVADTDETVTHLVEHINSALPVLAQKLMSTSRAEHEASGK